MGTDRRIEIAPSVLPADFSRLGEECAELEQAGVDRIQWDVMDGVFVPNLTFGPDVIAACRPHVTVPFEAHLMVVQPELLAERYVAAGCDMLILHAESTTHLHRALGQVRELGARPAVALNPATPAEAVRNVLDLVDMVLVMTVNPGFGGQRYIDTMGPKIETLRSWILEEGYECDIEVDGGIGAGTVEHAASHGANVLIAGTSMFNHPAGKRAAVEELRMLATQAAGQAGVTSA
jgi:ribulose-phosphate 3-epimerase